MADKPKQNIVDSEHKFTRLYEDGHASSPFLREAGDKLAQAMRTVSPDLLGDIEFSQGPVKGWERSAAKLVDNTGAGLDISKTEDVVDIVRGRIVVDTPDQIRAIRTFLNDPNQRAGTGVEYFKDRFAVPSDTHYRDMNLSVKLENGHVAEIQINQRDMLAASEFTHDSYEDMDAIKKRAVFDDRVLTLDEEFEVKNLNNYTRDVHDYGASKVPGLDDLLSDKGRARLQNHYVTRQKIDPDFKPGVTMEAGTKYGVPFVNRAEAYGGEGYKALAKQYDIAPDRLAIDTSSLQEPTIKWESKGSNLIAKDPAIFSDMLDRHGTSIERYKELGVNVKIENSAHTPNLAEAFNKVSGMPDGGLEAQMRSDMMPDRMTGGMRTGASGFGIGAGGYYAYQSYQQGDIGGVVLGSSNMIVSGADTAVDAAQLMGKSFAPAIGSTLMKGNVGLMVADSAYQVYKEEGSFIDEDGGLGHKGERAIAATGVTGTAFGGGMLLGGGSAAGGTLLATASAAAAPIILTGAAVVATAKFGDTMIEYSRLKDSMDKDAAEATAPLKFAQSEDGVPSLSNYKQSMFSAVKYSHEMRDDQMNGIIMRDEDNGRITNFKDIDWTDPRNLTEFETMLDTQIARQQEILQENSSVLPDLLRSSDSIDKEYFATTELMMLESAREELISFKGELAVYSSVSAPDSTIDLTAIFNGLPNTISDDMPPEVQALIEVKADEILFERQFEELKEHGGLSAVEEYMQDNPIDPEATMIYETSPVSQSAHEMSPKL